MKHGDRIKKKILDAGVSLWPDVTPSTVARKLEMTHAAVLYHYTATALKDAVAVHAVENKNASVIVSLLAMKHKATRDLTQEERDHYWRKIHKSART